MKHTKSTLLLFILICAIVACGGKSQDKNDDLDASPSHTTAPTEVVAPTAVILLPDTSEVAKDRSDAALVAEVISVTPGETFIKNWRLRNTGTQEWNAASGEYVWLFIGGDQMHGPSQVPIIGPIPPGGEYDIEMQLTAPDEPGRYEGHWQVQDPNGQPLGSEFSVHIEVMALSAQPPETGTVAETTPAESVISEIVVPIDEPTEDEKAPEPTTDDDAPPPVVAARVFEEGCLDSTPVADVTIPDGSVLEPGATFTKIWRIRNTGTCEWNSTLGDLQWAFTSGAQMGGPDQVQIVGPVPPGGEYDVELGLTAPQEPGQHEGHWKVHDPNGEPVGVSFWVLIEVPGAGTSTTPDDAPPADNTPDDSPPSAGGDLAQEVWRHINGERQQHRLYQLAFNEKLALAAQAHANDCSQRGSCSHTGSDGSDEAVRVRRVGYEGTVDESWAWTASPRDAVNWWLDEVPPNDWHRRMLLTDHLTEVGVGVAPAPSGGYFFIAVFGITGR